MRSCWCGECGMGKREREIERVHDLQKILSRAILKNSHHVFSSCSSLLLAPTSVYRKFSVKKRKDDNNELANNISIHRVLTLERESESGCWYRMRSKDTEEIEKNFAFHSCVGMLSTFSSTLECERFGRCSVSCGLFCEACHRGLEKVTSSFSPHPQKGVEISSKSLESRKIDRILSRVRVKEILVCFTFFCHSYFYLIFSTCFILWFFIKLFYLRYRKMLRP